MNKIVMMLLVLVMMFTGCQTGVEPNVPQTAKEEPAKEETVEVEAVEDTQETAVEEISEDGVKEEDTSEEEQSAEVALEEVVPEEVEEEEDATEAEVVEEGSDSASVEETSTETAEPPVIEAPVISGEDSTVSELLPEVTKPIVMAPAMTTEEVRAVWLSYIDLQPMFATRTESGYKQSLGIALDNISNLGMNTVMYQVRPFGDALYTSGLFPSSYVVTGTEGTALTYDPFGIAIDMAHERGLSIEAWINPYRVRSASSKIGISNNNIAKVWYEDGSRRVLRTKDGAMIYNPSIEEVQDHIVAGVKEIVDHYAVDGIHFDDYFYPTTDMSLDEIDYLSYQYDADPIPQDVYRRNNVNQLVKKVYQLVHSYNRNLVFGISPQGNIETNYEQLYVDIPMWLSAGGYVDYICPQVYFGFEHERSPYEQVMDDWAMLIHSDVDLIAGLAVYKVGATDQWAGTGSQEWVDSSRILQRMIETAKIDDHYAGYALFRYGSLFNPTEAIKERIDEEIQGITETITN